MKPCFLTVAGFLICVIGFGSLYLAAASRWQGVGVYLWALVNVATGFVLFRIGMIVQKQDGELRPHDDE